MRKSKANFIKKNSRLFRTRISTKDQWRGRFQAQNRIYELETKLSNREVKNSKLKKEILHLKKKQDDQSKELGKIGDDGPLQIQVDRDNNLLDKATDG